jgi:hypothetical protein
MLTDASSESKKEENLLYKYQAQQWLSTYGIDFQMVCDFAMLEPDHVQRVLQNWDGETKGILRRES